MPLSEQLEKARKCIRLKTDSNADIGIIFGSGLGDIAEQIDGVQIPYSDIEGFPSATAPSHKGVLHIGRWGGKLSPRYKDVFTSMRGIRLKR